MMKKIVLATTLGLFLIGCGGGKSNSDSNKEVTSKPLNNATSTTDTKSNIIKGKVVDGYVKDAKVCIDLNKNRFCDEGEPFTKSDKNGNYSLKLPDNKIYPIVSIGGTDIDTNEPAITMYSFSNYKNITPVTSLLINMTKEEIKEKFGIETDKIDKDPVALAKKGDTKLLEITKEVVQNIMDYGNIDNYTDDLKSGITETKESKESKEIKELTEKKDSVDKTAKEEKSKSNIELKTESTDKTPPVITNKNDYKDILLPPQIGE